MDDRQMDGWIAGRHRQTDSQTDRQIALDKYNLVRKQETGISVRVCFFYTPTFPEFETAIFFLRLVLLLFYFIFQEKKLMSGRSRLIPDS